MVYKAEDTELGGFVAVLPDEVSQMRWNGLAAMLAPPRLGNDLRPGRAIADALDAAHTKGTVYRDVKPENIFMTNRGTVSRPIKRLPTKGVT